MNYVEEQLYKLGLGLTALWTWKIGVCVCVFFFEANCLDLVTKKNPQKNPSRTTQRIFVKIIWQSCQIIFKDFLDFFETVMFRQ
jgi:hypothetical protein